MTAKERVTDATAFEDMLDAIGKDSFPASDPPAWPTTHLGAPCPGDGRDDPSSGAHGGQGL